MMEGKLNIDLLDAYSVWKAYIVGDGCKDIGGFPPFKSIETTNWAEDNGIEVDLTAPLLDTRDVQLSFAISGIDNYQSLIKHLTATIYHDFDFPDYDRFLVLRFVAVTKLEVVNSFCFATLKFADDFPLRNYTYHAPQSDLYDSRNEYEYKLDDYPFEYYGVRVLEGSFANIIKGGNAKQKLLQNYQTKSGVEYDSVGDAKLSSSDVTLTCLATAQNETQLRLNMDALLYNLSQPNARTLFIASLNKGYSCYYKSMSVKEFIVTPRPWLKFTLTLTIID